MEIDPNPISKLRIARNHRLCFAGSTEGSGLALITGRSFLACALTKRIAVRRIMAIKTFLYYVNRESQFTILTREVIGRLLDLYRGETLGSQQCL